MDFINVVQERYSVREFKDQAVEKEKILRVLEIARLAPSAVNYQPWHFIVLTDKQAIENIATETYRGAWLRKAPVLIVAIGDHSQSWKRRDGKDHCDIDLAISIDHLTLGATDLGLGTCWVCAFDAQRAKEILDLPSHLEVVALIPLGYPDEGSKPLKKRKDLEEIVSWERYGAK